MNSKPSPPRCTWAENDPLLRDYHDVEWGVPERDSRALWELLMLEGFQAGLAWIIVLRKRDAFRKAFKGFDPAKVARFRESDVERLLENPGIIRSRAKIESTIKAARIYLGMQKAGEDFATFLWGIVGGKPIRNQGPGPSTNAALRRNVEAAQEARLQICWPRDRVRLHAGRRHGKRSQPPLASAATPPAASKFVRYFALYPLHTHSSASGSVCCRTPRSTCPAFCANTNW